MVNKVTVSGIAVLVIGIVIAVVGSSMAFNSAMSLYGKLKNASTQTIGPGGSISLQVPTYSLLIVEASNSSCISPSPVPYAIRSTYNVSIMVYNESAMVQLTNNCTFNLAVKYSVLPALRVSSSFVTSGYLIILGGVLIIVGIITAVVGLVLSRRQRA